MAILLHNGQIVTDGKQFKGSILVENEYITDVFQGEVPSSVMQNSEVVSCEGKRCQEPVCGIRF